MLFVEALPMRLRGLALTALREFDDRATDGGARVKFWSVSSVALEGSFSADDLTLIAQTLTELQLLDRTGADIDRDRT